MPTEYRHNAKGVYQARDVCRHCKRIINHWHRCGQVPSIVLMSGVDDDGVYLRKSFRCPRCSKPSGVPALHGQHSFPLESVTERLNI